jgi:hypothetical protein
MEANRSQAAGEECMTKEVLTLALEALKYSDTVFYPRTSIAIAAIERALANHIEDNLAMVAQPTPAEYAMGYAEGFNDACKPNYTAPPQRTWIGLTDEEIQSCWDGDLSPYQMQCIREIEAKLKEKNHV